jgi:hypothetical protein
MPEPHLRAADTDRAAVASALGRYMAEGRLTLEEYDERVARAYAARTYGELDQLTEDLPKSGPGQVPERVRRDGPVPVRACGPMAGPWAGRGRAASAWHSWLRTALIVVTIWAVSSIASAGLLYYWPIWVIGPWGAVLLSHTLSGGHRPRGSRQRV